MLHPLALFGIVAPEGIRNQTLTQEVGVDMAGNRSFQCERGPALWVPPAQLPEAIQGEAGRCGVKWHPGSG